jgi:hypothetical protein
MTDVTDRITRLQITDVSDTRMSLLMRAHPWVSDKVFKAIGDAERVSDKDTIALQGWVTQRERRNGVTGSEWIVTHVYVGADIWTLASRRKTS